MATQTSNRVCDSSTLANFKSWAQAISTAFGTFGWSQSADTGQVNWSTIVSVPGTGAYVYEIWQPNDGISPTFYAKVEYGNWSGSSNSPSIRVTIGASTNGAGTITGTYIVGPLYTAFQNSITPPSAVTTYACYFSGAAGRFSCLMWPSAPNSAPQSFSIERSLDNTGAATATYVTLIAGGAQTGSSDWPHHQQQSLVFGVGITPTVTRNSGSGNSLPCLCLRLSNANGSSTAFNGTIPFDTVAPQVGYFDYPTTVVGVACPADVTEQVAFSVTLYGSSRTYMPTKASDINRVFNQSNGGQVAFCIRYD